MNLTKEHAIQFLKNLLEKKPQYITFDDESKVCCIMYRDKDRIYTFALKGLKLEITVNGYVTKNYTFNLEPLEYYTIFELVKDYYNSLCNIDLANLEIYSQPPLEDEAEKLLEDD